MVPSRIGSATLAAMICVIVLVTGSVSAVPQIPVKSGGGSGSVDDFEPLIDDFSVSVTILEIRMLDIHTSYPAYFCWNVSIASIGDPSQWSPYAWGGSGDLICPDWTFTARVNDSLQNVILKINLWDISTDPDSLCDISRDSGGGDGYPEDSSNVEISYDIAHGVQWSGDDYFGDWNGRGHVSGVEDGSVDVDQNDCELYYKVTQSDYDGDSLPYHVETATLGTNPKVSDAGKDNDDDGMPIEWEYYNQCSDSDPTDFTKDTDNDGLTALQEYQLRDWGTRYDYPDILLEIDYKAGNMPTYETCDIIEQYFASYQLPDGHFGANVIIDLDDELPEASSDPNGDGYTSFWEFDREDQDANDIAKVWFTPERVSIWRYCLITDRLDPTWNPYTQEFVFLTLGGTVLWNTRNFTIADQDIDQQVDDHNLFHVLHPDLDRDRAVANVIMHELGHNLDIINWEWDDENDQWVEDYCDDTTCAMAMFDCCELSHAHTSVPRYCSVHLSQIDLDVWKTVRIAPPPDP